MVFVDYEYWFYSYKNKYNLRPDTAAWRAELEKQFDIEDIMIFADFSSPGIGEELAKLRNITNTIIETGTATQYRKKDMTDFVMLDYIYQNVTSRNDVGTYISATAGCSAVSIAARPSSEISTPTLSNILCRKGTKKLLFTV